MRQAIRGYVVLMRWVLVWGILMLTYLTYPAALHSHTGGMLPGADLTPHWTAATARAFPRCHNIENRPEGVIPNRVVVVTQYNQTRTMPFDKAWAERKTATFWTVGYCV